MKDVVTYAAAVSPDGETVQIMRTVYYGDVTETLTERLRMSQPDATIITGRGAQALWDAAKQDKTFTEQVA